MNKERLWETKPTLWLLLIGQRVRTQCMAHHGEKDQTVCLDVSKPDGRGIHQNWLDNRRLSNAHYHIQPTVESARV